MIEEKLYRGIGMKKRLLFVLVSIIGCYVSIAHAQTSGNDKQQDRFATAAKTTSSLISSALYANDFGSPSNIYAVYPATGTAVLIGSTDHNQITDIAFKDNTLYGTTFSELLVINPDTGFSTTIGVIGYGANSLAVADNGVIYAGTLSGELITIDEVTGVGTLVGSFGSGLATSGDIAFAPSGILYASVTTAGAGTDSLATINIQTGEATFVGDMGYAGVYGLVFGGDTLYGTTSGGRILQINMTSGASSEIVTEPISFAGLAVPASYDSSYPLYLPIVVK